MKHLLLLNLMASVLLIGCSSENPDRQAPPAGKASAITLQSEQSPLLADPKVNILFVVDNSGSMKTYQEKMSKNIELFANQFFKNKRIDFRIGVVPVYDSKYLNDQTVYSQGKRIMNTLGELRPLKGLSPEDKVSRLFITRDTLNAKEVLKQSVTIGVQWGPEAEESFTPVLAMADPQINSTKNENFYQEDAYLAVIFLTDADDVSVGLSGEDFYQSLVDLKGGDRSKVLIAAALPNLRNSSSSCTKDGRGPTDSFPALMAASGGIFADLCSDRFGARLADFGKYLVQRVAAKRIALGFTPDIYSLQVSYGPVGSTNEAERIQIPRGSEGYYFDPERNEVILSPNLNLPRLENAVIFINSIPVDLSNYKNGRLEKI